MSARSARAELIEDRGAAAAGDDFFRSRPFLDAEGVTHTLRIETTAPGPGAGRELLAPLIVRPIGDSPERDAVSPYGYPGFFHPPRGRASFRIAEQSSTTPLVEPGEVDWSATGLVSIFIRHTLGEPPLAGSTERNVVQIADPALPAKSRPSDRRQVRRNDDAGYKFARVRGPETTPEQRAGFLGVYEQTMRRTGAADHYFFGAAYFDRILAAEQTRLALVTAPDGELAAASIVALSDGCLHYYLSGSADSHLADSPMKNLVSKLTELAAELKLPLNLGGGLSPGDALEEFKRGFANRRETWRTSEIVCDAERYEQLSGDRIDGSFFPAYRAQ